MIILYLNNYQAALLASLTELQEALDRLKGAKAQFPEHCVAMDTIHYLLSRRATICSLRLIATAVSLLLSRADAPAVKMLQHL